MGPNTCTKHLAMARASHWRDGEKGFKRGASNASELNRPTWDVRVMVRGDDFLALGDKDHSEKVEATLRGAYELKCLGVIGDEEGDRRELHFLNWFIRRGEHEGKPAIFIEADRRRAELQDSELRVEERERC